MGLKGQSQLLIVLGILVFVIVVILFATNTVTLLPPEPEEISQLKQSLKTDVEESLRADAFEVIKTVSEQGGYWLPSEQPQSVTYKGSEVAYWKLGNQNLPRTKQQVASEISRGLTQYVNLDADELSSKFGKTVTLGPVYGADVNIKSDEVTLKINVPVSIEGYPVRDIEVTVPAKLGEALDFADSLMEANNNDKLFENFMIVSLLGYQRLGFDGAPRVPSMGVLEGCGKFFHKDWFSVRPEMEELIRGILSNTYTAGKIPEGVGDTSPYPGHVLPVFTNMKTKFSLGESLDENNFQMAPNPIEVKTSSPTYVPVCLSNPYRVDYWLLFPVVAELGDNDYKFQFAFNVFVLGYKPGEEEDLQINLDGWRDQILTCKNALCEAKIKVSEINGPLGLATVSYAGCNLGLTDSQGIIKSKIPCGISLLEVSKGGYTQYTEMYSSDELEDKNINLFSNRIPTVKINLYNLILEENSGAYTVKDVVPNNKDVAIAALSEEGDKFSSVSFSEETDKSFLVTNSIPPGITDISLIVKESGKTLGGVLAPYYILDYDQELWIYSPILEAGIVSDKEGVEQASEEGSYVFALSNVSIECGGQISELLPISRTPVDIDKIKTCVV